MSKIFTDNYDDHQPQSVGVGFTDYTNKELEDKIMDILGLEKDLLGQVVLKNYEDVQSDWRFTVRDIVALIKQAELKVKLKGE